MSAIRDSRGCYKKSHGQGRTKLYRAWTSMRQRCNNPSDPAYKNYGGRGVSVFAEWEKFENFYRWAVSSGYSSDLCIERKNNDLGYYPENCKWATRTEQNRNKRDIKLSLPKANRIREFYATGAKTAELSLLFNVTKACIRAVVNRKTWIQA